MSWIPRPQVYWSYRQRAQDRMALVVRTDGDATALMRPVIAAIREADPDQPVYDVRTMTAVVERATGQQWLNAAVLGAFAIVALVMSAVGVYGVVAYGVRLRAREFSVRIALGARRSDVLLMVFRRGAMLVGCGVAIGMIAAVAVTRVLTGLLHGVSSTDMVSFALAILALVVPALIATIVPERRACRRRTDGRSARRVSAAVHDHERFMRVALEEARRAELLGEVPIGAVVVIGGVIVGAGCNQPITTCDPTAHAEIVALRGAAHAAGNYRLTGATLYVTVEPCLMCVGALVHARIGMLVYGTVEPKAGAVHSTQRALEHLSLNHRVEAIGGVLEEECRAVLQAFFRARRQANQANALDG